MSEMHATDRALLEPQLQQWRGQDVLQRKLVYQLLKRAMLHAYDSKHPQSAKAFAAAIDVLAFTADGGVV